MPQKKLAKADAADRLGISLRELERCVQEGAPVSGKPGKRTYPWPELRTWYNKHVREQERRRLEPTSLAEAEKRKAIADAEMAEEKLRAYRGQLVPLELFQRELANTLVRIRSLIRGHPKLRAVADEILNQLADQPPDELEASATADEAVA